MQQTNESRESIYQLGYEDGWLEHEPGEPVGDPIGVDEDYALGWWSGAMEVTAFVKGWEAYLAGVYVCPYIADIDDPELRWRWLQGYVTAMDDYPTIAATKLDC